MTRWATGDIAGRLIKLFDEQGRKYKLITKKAYDEKRVDKQEIINNFGKYNVNNIIDLSNYFEKLQEENEKQLATQILDKTMLNSNILNFKQYQNVVNTMGEDIVDANYNQRPIDKKGKLYQRFLTYNPADIKSIDNLDGKIVFTEIRARADVADQRNRLFINDNLRSNKR